MASPSFITPYHDTRLPFYRTESHEIISWIWCKDMKNLSHEPLRSCVSIALNKNQASKERYLQHLLTRLPMDKIAGILTVDTFKWIFLNENGRIPIWMSLKFVPMSSIDNKAALVQVKTWRRIGDKPWLSSPTYICGTGGRWVLSLSFWKQQKFRPIFNIAECS